MANTALLSAVASMLMQGRPEQGKVNLPYPIPAPIPQGGFKPPGGFGMPMMEAEPTMAPVAPMPSVDANLIAQLTGAPPVAPTPQPVSLLQKVALALQGFGAGAQGQGPQFLAQLREERERPQREFEAATERFQQRRAGAVEFAERKAERQQAATQAQADAQSEREFRQWVQRTGATDARALELLRQTFETERDARKAETERLEQERRDLARRQEQARLFARDAAKLGASPELAREIGEYWSGIRESLSPAAAKFESTQSRLAEMRMRRDSIGGGGRASASDAATRAVATVESLKAELLGLERRPDSSAQAIRAVRQRIDRAIGALSRFPGQAQGGLDDQGYPWAKIWNGQQFVGIVPDGAAPAPGARQPQPMKTITMAQIRASASEAGIDESEAVQQFKDAGYTIQQ